MNSSKSKTSKTGGSKGITVSKSSKKGGMLNPQLPIIVGAPKIMDLHANIPYVDGVPKDAFNSMPSEGSELGYLQTYDVAGGSLNVKKSTMGKKPPSGGTSNKKAQAIGSKTTNKTLVGGGNKKTAPKGGSSSKNMSNKKKSP